MPLWKPRNNLSTKNQGDPSIAKQFAVNCFQKSYTDIFLYLLQAHSLEESCWTFWKRQNKLFFHFSAKKKLVLHYFSKGRKFLSNPIGFNAMLPYWYRIRYWLEKMRNCFCSKNNRPIVKMHHCNNFFEMSRIILWDMRR